MKINNIIILSLFVFGSFLYCQETRRSIGIEIPHGEPIAIAVEMSKYGLQLGLTEKDISEKVSEVLNKNGIMTTKTHKGYYLSVDVEIDENSYGIVLKFRRIGYFTIDETIYEQYVTSWITYSIGSHNNKSKKVIDGLMENVGYFLDGFRKSNPK